MQGGEVLWRVRQAVASRSSSDKAVSRLLPPSSERAYWSGALAQFRIGADGPVLLDAERARMIADRNPELVAHLIAKADQTVDGTFEFFGYPAIRLRQPIEWNRDPFSDVLWPDTPSHRIDHRTAGGDVKWIWELNRLQHLPWLAEAWLFTGDRRYSETAFDHLDTWIDQNTPGRGITWRGAFEAGLRGISVAVALQGLRDSPELTSERYERIVNMLTHSAVRCWRERSLFSSANNHLVGEMTGLAVIAMLLPHLPMAKVWERRAVEMLSAHAGKQILPDGSGAEQSVGYQIATVELLNLAAALLLDRDRHAPDAITGAIDRSTRFFADCVAGGDPDPRYGDSDQEFAIRLGPEEVWTVRQHLGAIASFDWGKAGAGEGSDSLTAAWYRFIGHNQLTSDPSKADSFHARDGGLVILRSGRRRTTVDVGPLGYLSIAAHGHADALAVTVSVDGADVIGDPGTGSYYRHPQWRTVMRGTRAHSTVSIDDEDQSVIGGPFLWSRHARTTVLGVDLGAGIVDAEHDGYARLRGGVIHRRWVIAPPHDRAQLVVDLISGDGVHTARTCWPLHPRVDAARQDRQHLLSSGDVPLLQLMHASTAALSLEDSFGDEANGLGWWSDRLESRVPCWWLSAVSRGQLPIAVATLITPSDAVVTADLSVDMGDGNIEVRWLENDRGRAVCIRLAAPAAVSVA